MPLSTALRRVPLIGALLGRKRPSGPVYPAVLNSGIVIAAPDGASPGEIAVTLLDGAGRDRLGSGREPVRLDADGTALLSYPLDPSLFELEKTLRLAIRTPRGSFKRTLTVGIGHFAGAVEGIEDYCVVGWASPLFPAESFSVRLSIDGVPGPENRPNVLRRDLMAVSRHGGWNGFRLPLPPAALDGTPHRIAVLAGDSVFDLGAWTARPKLNVDEVSAERLTGWIFDPEALDRPLTLELRDGERRIGLVRTGPRSDLAEKFGRGFAAFAFTDVLVRPGVTLSAGEAGALRLGRVAGAELGARVAEERQGARRLLLAGDGPRATAASRRAIRERIAELRRDRPAPLAFELAGDARPAPPPAPRPAGTAESPPVCVIVPVYRGRADLEACLDSLRPELAPGRVRAIVINDASPEAEIGRYLAELAADPPPGLTILENGSNLGFVGTVNRGFAALAPGEDALVLNADTVLAPGALARLAAHCHARPGVASVTPLSNTATILGFPHPPEPNPPAFGLDAATIDAALRAVGAAPLEIPTAIGFCMYLNGEALAEAGPFSPEWGRGYCEEVDWSLIARDLGWIHLAAPDAFVMHEGSVSFGRSERSRILAENHARLEAKYPDYLAEVHAFLRADPLEETRIGALARLLAGQASRLTLHVTHGLGGGTSRHIADLAARPRPPGHEFATVLPLDDALRPDRIVLRFDRSGTEISLRAASFGRLAAALEEAGIALAIEVHSRLGHHSALLDAIRSGGRPYRATLHDFQWYCPKVHLTDERDFHCGEPPPDICQICVRHPLPNHDPHDFGDETELVQRDIEAWLAGNAAFLRGAERIVAPSQDTADRYLRRLDLDTVVVEPHGEPERAWRERPSVRRPRTGALRVAVVGAIGFHKGFDLLVRLAERAAHDRAPFYLRVIGYTPDNAQLTRLPNADVTGPYASGELPALLDAFDPDFVFFSSVWPETYSYVLSEVWAAGYPVVAFDLGAPAERIRALGGGVLLEPTRDAGRLLAALLEVRDRAAASPIPGPPTAGTA